MHLKSITVKGFKSFPDRTKLEFGPGVSVIVGPNGSGKSNITDAVLWALGEQSPLAVRGQSMQDVIFAGSAGVKSRGAAEVEITIDNSDGNLHSEFSEVCIARRLDRSGEGVYRMNGARCRLVDVMEVLSDSGLGKEMHSVISQGRVEAIIHSKPFDRTSLIEEAAGLSKHRKRRHRAQLKLARTQDNLDRALDVEREARSRLRPLKRQAEAAELHARLERQSLELQGRLVADSLRLVRLELGECERAAGTARERRDQLQGEQADVARQREQAERALAAHGRDREQLTSNLYGTRSAGERIAIRLESVRALANLLRTRLERSRRALDEPEPALEGDAPERLARLENELAALEQQREARIESETAKIELERSQAAQRVAELEGQIDAKREELERADRAAEEGRDGGRAAAERAQESARRQGALELELERLRERRRAAERSGGPSLADTLRVDEGFEAAVAAALGGRLRATVVEDMGEGARALERSGDGGARALVKGRSPAGPSSAPPMSGASRLLHHVSCDPEVRELVVAMLGDTWVVDDIASVPEDFEGIAVTREGLSYRGRLRELRRLPAETTAGGLGDRGRLEQLEAELVAVTAELENARAEVDRSQRTQLEAGQARDSVEAELRDLRRAREHAEEQERRGAWLIEQRRELSIGPDEARRSELTAEIAAERRLAEGLARQHEERLARRRRLEATVERDRELLPAAERLAAALQGALRAVETRRTALEAELHTDEEVGESQAAELRRLAQAEYDLQARLREAGELLTQQEVRVAQVRDREQLTASELASIADRLGRPGRPDPLEPEAVGGGGEPLADEERVEVEARLERVGRRRERLGPVNPLAQREYEDAVEHVDELETQRKDLEAALAELEGLIRETDRRIRESFEQTFEAAARNFEEVIQQLFPGGSGRLRLVKPQRPRAVLGGAEPGQEQADGEGAADDDAPSFGGLSAEGDAPVAERGPADETPGIEIEVTPAGKSTKRLSLLSGGEKSLVALGFLFAVFLARPCPFYILDEVEAALDDANIDRFLALVRGFSDRSQFIVITHQRRTMEAADVLYGVSMGRNGISRVVSRKLDGVEPVDPPPPQPQERLTEAA